MTASERKELIYTLALNYLLEKENKKVWQREDNIGFTMARGKLTGACMAFELDYEEAENSLTIFTRGKKKVVTKVIIED